MDDPASSNAPPAARGAGVLEVLSTAIFPGSRVVAARTLVGGISSRVQIVDLRQPDGMVQTIVLKRFIPEYLERTPGAFLAERQALALLAPSGLPVPRLLWSDSSGSVLGTPALALTYLPGRSLMRAMRTFKAGDRGWLHEVAEVLVRSHAVPVPAVEVDLQPLGTPSAVEAGLAPLLTADERAERATVLPNGDDTANLLRETRLREQGTPLHLLHGDFHPSNLLWHEGHLSGVLDWGEARLGAREYDLCHMRWELALRLDPHVADDFLSAYQEASGYTPPAMTLWDLQWAWRLVHALPSWVEFFALEGESISLDELRQRRDRWLRHVLGSPRQKAL